MKSFALIVSVLSCVTLASAADFPRGPEINETPGKLCSSPSSRRYPEKINYCERNVDSYLKNAIIQKYDSLFGYHIRSMNRGDFKIDHLVPLCAGGANDPENLWPQHKSVYAITDPIEPILCEKMQEGKLLQAEAVKLIMKAKLNLKEAPGVLKYLKSL